MWSQWRTDYPKWIADNLPAFFVPETSRAMINWGGTLLQAPVPIALACSRAMAEEDFREEMRRVEVPSLIIHGDRDRSMPVEITGKPSAALLRHCRFVTYEGAPHGLMYTHAHRLHSDLLKFIGET
jgi:pimeloyl-ACP methyl ester carboxylesterase